MHQVSDGRARYFGIQGLNINNYRRLLIYDFDKELVEIRRQLDLPVEDGSGIYRTEERTLNRLQVMTRNLNTNMVSEISTDIYVKPSLIDYNEEALRKYGILPHPLEKDLLKKSLVLANSSFVPPFADTDKDATQPQIAQDLLMKGCTVVAAIAQVWQDAVRGNVRRDAEGSVDVAFYLSQLHFRPTPPDSEPAVVAAGRIASRLVKLLRKFPAGQASKEYCFCLMLTLYSMASKQSDSDFERGPRERDGGVRQSIFGVTGEGVRESGLFMNVSERKQTVQPDINDPLEVSQVFAVIVCILGWNSQWACFWQTWAKVHRVGRDFVSSRLRDIRIERCKTVLIDCYSILREFLAADANRPEARRELNISKLSNLLKSVFSLSFEIDSFHGDHLFEYNLGEGLQTFTFPMNSMILNEVGLLNQADKPTVALVCQLMNQSMVEHLSNRLVRGWHETGKAVLLKRIRAKQSNPNYGEEEGFSKVSSLNLNNYCKETISTCEEILSLLKSKSFKQDELKQGFAWCLNLWTEISKILTSYSEKLYDLNSIKALCLIYITIGRMGVDAGLLSEESVWTQVYNILGMIGSFSWKHIIETSTGVAYGADEFVGSFFTLEVFVQNIAIIIDSMIESLERMQKKTLPALEVVLTNASMSPTMCTARKLMEVFTVGLMIKLKLFIQINLEAKNKEFIRSYPFIDKQLQRINDSIKSYDLGNCSLEEVQAKLLDKWLENT